MSFDRMGRRVEYLETVASDAGGSQLVATNAHHRFVYDGYLCVKRLNAASGNANDLSFTWDPLEKVATRLLMVAKTSNYRMYVTHDGNKNVSELVFFGGLSGIAAHYEYAPFGAVTVSTKNTSVYGYDFRTYNPFRFSSEYADDALGLVYYNYRHYNPVDGRWTSRDMLDARELTNLYLFLSNMPLVDIDSLGNSSSGPRPWNRPLPPCLNCPRVKPIIVIPHGPSVPADGGLIDALAGIYAMSFRFKFGVIAKGVYACNLISPRSIIPCSKVLEMRAAPCKCCVISYLAWEVADQNLYYLEFADVYDKSCEDVQSEGFLLPDPKPLKRGFHIIPWR